MMDMTTGAAQLAATTRSQPGYTNTFEVGYSGLLFDKLKVGIDFYTYEVQGFTQFTAIGPTVGLVNSPQSLAAGEMGTAAGIDEIPGQFGSVIAANFAGSAYGQQLAQADPVAFAVTQAFLTGAFTSAGEQALEAAPASAYAALGAVETTRVPQNDGVVHIPAGYRRFNDAKRDHYGIDFDLEYFATDELSFFANGSWLSQIIWEVGDDDLPFSSYLNAPKEKYRGGVRYANDKFRASATYLYDEAFMANVGQFAGMAPQKNVVDANIGYTFANGLRFDITASNLFDNEYRAFANMPIIGRRVIGKLTFDL